MNDAPPGVYFLRIALSNGPAVLRFVHLRK
jgi:hypothetical protein